MLEQVMLWVLVGLISLIGLIIAGVALFERRQRKRVEALGRRKKQKIKL
jgi:cytochrome c-type biogenesis protein CcmH/NrfF